MAEQLPADVNAESHNLGKRKRDDMEKANGDSKLQEFLEVMRPPSKSRTWANEDSRGTQSASDLVLQDQVQKVEAGQSDEEYEAVPKKGKPSRTSEGFDDSFEPAEVANTAEATEHIENHVEIPKDGNGRELSPVIVLEPTGNAVPAATDEDWLRSRTSRLLDLVDDEDALRSRHLPQAGGGKPGDSAVLEQPQLKDPSNTGVQTGEETDTANVGAAERLMTGNENVDHGTGRLFIRNLMYNTAEQDLREHFEVHKYGVIEEVWLRDFHSLRNPLLWFCDDHPDRDSLCYACDVTRKNILVDASYV